MARFDLIIFDCDGVLIDSEILSAHVLLEALNEIGIEIDFSYFFANCLGHNFKTVAQRLVALTGRALPADFETRCRVKLLARFEAELKPIPGIAAVLAQLAVPFCVATSSSQKRAGRALEIVGLSGLVGNHLYTSEMVAHGKPAPDLFLFAAAAMGVDPAKCLVIEDSNTGVLAARAASMAVWRFTGGSHMQTGHRKPHLECLADQTFASMADFAGLLRAAERES